MYLLAIFTLIVALASMYAQVVSLQATRMLESQRTVAQTMMLWQNAAISMAASIIDTNNAAYGPIAAAGCSLTFSLPPTALGLTRCPSPKNGVVSLNAVGGGTLTDNAATPALNRIHTSAGYDECVHLPASCPGAAAGNCAAGGCKTYYDTTNAQFYSVLYYDATIPENLVITFLPAAASANSFLNMALGNSAGVTGASLMLQMRAARIPNYSFGIVNSSNKLVVNGNQYTLPATIPNLSGAVAVIGSPDGF